MQCPGVRLAPSKVRVSTLPQPIFIKFYGDTAIAIALCASYSCSCPLGAKRNSSKESVWSTNSKLFPASPFTEKASTGKMGTKEQPGVIQCRRQILEDNFNLNKHYPCVKSTPETPRGSNNKLTLTFTKVY